MGLEILEIGLEKVWKKFGILCAFSNPVFIISSLFHDISVVREPVHVSWTLFTSCLLVSCVAFPVFPRELRDRERERERRERDREHDRDRHYDRDRERLVTVHTVQRALCPNQI